MKPGIENFDSKIRAFGFYYCPGLAIGSSTSDFFDSIGQLPGFHTWSVDEVRRFEERHPPGTKARLALALLLYLGVRRGDVVKLGPRHLKGNEIAFVPSKTSHQ